MGGHCVVPLSLFDGPITSAGYREVSECFMIPPAKIIFRESVFIFEEDNTPSHNKRLKYGWKIIIKITCTSQLILLI